MKKWRRKRRGVAKRRVSGSWLSNHGISVTSAIAYVVTMWRHRSSNGSGISGLRYGRNRRIVIMYHHGININENIGIYLNVMKIAIMCNRNDGSKCRRNDMAKKEIHIKRRNKRMKGAACRHVAVSSGISM